MTQHFDTELLPLKTPGELFYYTSVHFKTQSLILNNKTQNKLLKVASFSLNSFYSKQGVLAETGKPEEPAETGQVPDEEQPRVDMEVSLFFSSFFLPCPHSCSDSSGQQQ